tara:strand:+ start:28638 stop:28913 length:276 start_codon:yes stop_codon:yes gene_type:complete
MTTEAEIKHLKSLASSKGWAEINKVMESEILQLALLMARKPDMTQQQMDFQRGAIWAAEQLLNLPSKLIVKLEGDLTLENTMRQGPSDEGD